MTKKMCILVDESIYEKLTKSADKRYQSTSSLISQRLSVTTDLIEKSRELNPYPDDIFTPMTAEEWQKVTKALQDAGISPDKVFGNWGRRVWSNCTETILKEFLD